MVVVSGIGWIDNDHFGSVFQNLNGAFSRRKDLLEQLLERQVLHEPLPPLGRYDRVSRVTCYAVGLCLHDAGIDPRQNGLGEIGIIGANTSGCLDSNVDYFQDFVSSGRTLGRGNLFIYTLPSSPIAASSIYFSLEGPTFYLSFSQDRVAQLLRSGAHMVASGETDSVVAVDACSDRGLAFFLCGKSQAGKSNGLPADQVHKLARDHSPESSFDAFIRAVNQPS